MRHLLRAGLSLVLGATLLASVPSPAQALMPDLVPVSFDGWPAIVDPTRVGSISVQAMNLGDEPGTLTFAGRADQTVSDGEVVTLDLAGLTDGNYKVQLRLCPEAGGCMGATRYVHIRRQPYARVTGNDDLLNENGDEFWESVTPQVELDSSIAVTATWRITDGDRLVAGPFDLTAAQVAAARSGQAAIAVNAETVGKKLAAGDYRFEVEAAASENEIGKTAVADWEFHVSNAPALTQLTPSASVFYPEDLQPGVAHRMVLSQRLDSRVVRYGADGYEILDAGGRVVSARGLDPLRPVMEWDGRFYQGDTWAVAPPGSYRIRLNLLDDGVAKEGLVSSPIRLSHYRRTFVEVATKRRSAVATRIATLNKVAASVRAKNGSLLYQPRQGRTYYPTPLVRTVHRIKVPSDYVSDPTLRVRGRWDQPTDLRIEVVTPKGKVIDEGIFRVLRKRRLEIWIRPRWIRRDGTVKFRLLWRGDHAGRTDSIAISRMKYRWVK